MNGFSSDPRYRLRRTVVSAACLGFLAFAVSSHAASLGKSSVPKTAVSAELRAAIHQALGDSGWAQTQEFIGTDAGFDPEFGSAVAVHGTTAMISAMQATINGNEAQGAVHVFNQAPDGTWSEVQQLLASDGQADATFGNAIVFNDTTAVIGAYGTPVNGNFSQGAAYVFTLAGGSWTQTQIITADDGQMFDNFGYSLGLNGTTLMIGADAAQIGDNGFQGAVYVYDGSTGTWTNTQKLTASDGGIGDIFGYSIAFDGTNALIGAYANNGYQGAVYVYDGSTGTWTNTQKLTASDGGIGDIFGYSIAFDGTNTLIGAYANNGYQGAVYAYSQTGGVWSETQKLVADDGAPNTYFGYATALSGSTFLVGAWGANPDDNDSQGAAYVFKQSNGTWTQTQELGASDGQPHDNFGHAVALQGTTALIGTPGWSAATAQGAVYVFDGSSGQFVETQTLTASDGQPADQFGMPVTIDGNTILVGSWLYRAADGSMPGSAYFFGFNATPPATYTIGGTVSGLAGSGLVLQQSGGDNLSVAADGSFTFATPIDDGATYSVTVSAQPGNPAQTCTVANGSGSVAGANVDNVAVTCTTDVSDRIFADGFEGAPSGGGSATLAQTTDTTPVGQNSVACGNNADNTTADNQYWRRYYFSDYAVATAADVASVDVSVEQTSGSPSMTVTLYTIPHSVTVDTIDISQLTQIAQTTVAAPADAALTSVNVPITGTIADTVGNDLVVEVSTDDFAGEGMTFYIGSTTSPETHPSFLSSAACSITDPTTTNDIGFPNMHVIEGVNVTY